MLNLDLLYSFSVMFCWMGNITLYLPFIMNILLLVLLLYSIFCNLKKYNHALAGSFVKSSYKNFTTSNQKVTDPGFLAHLLTKIKTVFSHKIGIPLQVSLVSQNKIPISVYYWKKLWICWNNVLFQNDSISIERIVNCSFARRIIKMIVQSF